MQLQLDTLDAHLSQSLSMLYVIVGDELLLMSEAIDKIRHAARLQEFNERQVFSIGYNFKWNDLFIANQSQSLFSVKKLIELRIFTHTLSTNTCQMLQNYVINLYPNVLTIISLPKLDTKTQKHTLIYTLKNIGTYIDVVSIKRTQLPTWIKIRLEKQQQNADQQSLEFMADQVEGNLLAAHQEIQKLRLLYPLSTNLTIKHMRHAVLNTAYYDIFSINIAILSSEITRIIKLINNFHNHQYDLPKILWVVTEEIRILLKVKAYISKGKELTTLFKQYRIWGLHETLIKSVIYRINITLLQTALKQAAQIDKIIKGIVVKTTINNAWDSLIQLCIKLASNLQK